MKRNLLGLVLGLLWIVTGVAESERLPRVLILGDSISMGYTPEVRSLLQGKAVVVRPKENCEGTTLGVTKVEDWMSLEGGHWDVIHFNFGLHDIKRVDAETRKNSNKSTDPRQAELEDYLKNLETIVRHLKRTGARLIFASTTPVPPGGVRPHRDVEDPARYNAAALALMEREGVKVNDLYSAILPRVNEFQRPVDVHFTADGSRFLAEKVAAMIEANFCAVR